ncbi:hypothetical protein [Embleya sp. NBC_00896]|uniref:hypothetical protein n=1 Tax=Embleya sp. NBC_00896 TaxID=2975961 RepID=UPI00386A78F9|nr:hypothetical protein OG928_21905 [Embleya sp. NBC_00896]
MSDAGAVRAFRMATHREGGVEPRLVAMRDFLANASDAELERNRGLIESQIEAVATQQPETAARMLADVLARDPRGRYPRGVDAVLRWWAVQPSNGFADTWDALDKALETGPRPLERALLDVLGGLDARAPAPRWRVAATARVLERLEERFEQPSRHPDHDLWRLLPMIAPPGAPSTRGEWVCVIGDRAAARGDEAEARTCYRLAFEQGCAAAAPRLAHRLAVEGHRELAAGDAVRAVRFLYEAAMLDPDHAEYRELHLAAIAARDGRPGGARAGSAVALVADAAELLDRGDDMGAVRLLRRGLADPAQDDRTWPARLLLGALEGDDAMVAGAARDLVELHGDAWARRTPLGPGLVLHRVTRADPELAATLVEKLPPDLRAGRLARAVSTAAAYRILAAGVRALGAGRPDEARARAERAERLLGGDEA